MTITKRIRRYKYLPFDEGSLRIISDGTIKFTAPNKVNDPFDCAPDFETHNIAEYLDTRPDLLERAGDKLKLSAAQRIEQKPTMIRRLKRDAEQGVFGQHTVDKIGICSLSRDPLNLLMWAHYAHHHKGFVVEFDIPAEATGVDDRPTNWLLEWLIPQEVAYQKSKPVVNFFDDRDVVTKKRFLIKGEAWKYEQEERVIDYVRGHGVHSYDRKTILHSVIAGMKMDEPNFTTLRRSIDRVNQELDLEIELHQTKAVRGKFELFVPTRSDLTPSGEP